MGVVSVLYWITSNTNTKVKKNIIKVAKSSIQKLRSARILPHGKETFCYSRH